MESIEPSRVPKSTSVAGINHLLKAFLAGIEEPELYEYVTYILSVNPNK